MSYWEFSFTIHCVSGIIAPESSSSLHMALFDIVSQCARAHKMSIVQSAYEMSKLQVSFGQVKRQESLAKEQLGE